MLIKTVEICDGLNSICLTDEEGNEHIYLQDVEDDTISRMVDYSKFGDTGLRIITDNNEYQIEFN